MSAGRSASTRLGLDARTVLTAAALFALLTLAFYASPWDGGADWQVFYDAAHRAMDLASPLYGTPTAQGYHYYNPPWLAVLCIPLALLPFRLGWAALAAATLGVALLLLRRWNRQASLAKPVLVLLSPPMFYTIMHGQVDLLIIGGVLLPAQWWALVALTKPQAALGLLAGVPRARWLQAGLLAGAVIAVSLVWFGNWPRALLNQPTPFMDAGHNLWAGLWPFQIPAGVLLIALGMQRRDERLLIAGTPFLSPYAALSSFAGPWIAAITWLSDRQAAAVFASWWGAVITRALGG